MSKINPTILKGPGDFGPPDCPDEDAPECPRCDGPMRETDSGTWRGFQWASYECSDDACGGSVSNEPDWEDIASERAW